MTPQKKGQRILTGLRVSGSLHLGNYLGAIRPALGRQEGNECLLFIADLHTLTTTKDPKVIRDASYDLVATWLALGLDVKKHMMYRQSDLPIVTEFAWYLSCVTGMGLLEKGHAYKDAVANGKDVNHGVFAYPVLMAADILMYDADIVPVGKDQKQHVEMARDIAGSFNAVYGEGIIRVPEPSVDERVMTIPGLDGRKMSKSYGNVIPLFSSAADLRKKVLSIKTDSSSLEDSKTITDTLVGNLYSLFGDTARYNDLEERMKRGGMGWGHAKDELFQVIDSHLAPHRQKYDELRQDETYLNSVLKDGAARARAIAGPILTRVRNAVGFA